MLSEEKFYDRAAKFNLFKNTEGKYFTLDEYKEKVKDAQTDKDGNLVILYTNNENEQHSYVQAVKDKGYDVIVLDGQLDTHLVNAVEQKNEKIRFTRVDADVVERLIAKEDLDKSVLTKNQQEALTSVFQSQLPKLEKTEFIVEVNALGSEQRPVVITQNEWMRRMKEMSRYQSGMAFYGQMPDSFNLVLNSDHRLVKQVLDDAQTALAEQLKPIEAELRGQQARLAALNQQTDKKKPEEVTQAEKDDKAATQKAIDEQNERKQQLISDYAQKNDVVHQLIDLALLQNGLLRGAALDAFVQRSVELIK
jgi:molecular chaperone HtpG